MSLYDVVAICTYAESDMFDLLETIRNLVKTWFRFKY